MFFIFRDQTLEKSVRAEKVVKKQPSGVQKYAIQLLKETGSARIWQAKAPSMPEGYRLSNSILEQVHEVHVLSYYDKRVWCGGLL